MRELYSSQPVSIIEGNMSTCEQDSTYTVYNNCHLQVFYTPPPPSSLHLPLPLALLTFFSTVVRSFLITLVSEIRGRERGREGEGEREGGRGREREREGERKKSNVGREEKKNK